MKNDKTDFTQGSILKKLALFMLPILGALVLQAAYGAVDLLVVGRFGSTSGLSAVSTGSQVLNLVTFVVTQLAMGVTVLIARYLGEKKHEFISPVIGGAAVVFALLAAVLFGVLVFLARPISSLMQAPAEALDLTTSYVRICGAGIFFIVAYNMLSALFRGLGDSRSPLIFVLVACVVNIIGDLVLVAGFHLDAVGAAIATVSRAAGSATYPSRFQLVAAMNPCKCGYYGHPTRPCTCSPSAVRQYRSRVSGPLLDRIDLCVEMDPVAFDELHTSTPAESSADLRKQVLAARAVQAKRYAAPGYEGVRCNAQLTAGQVRRVCRMTPAAERLLRASYDTLGLSARAHDRILRVARTVADLAGKQLLDEEALLEALQYRAQEKVETF